MLDRDIAELEHGLNTVIGSKGVKISGGQRQRTAPARIIVRQPELLVLDDLSSALDVETEHQLWERVFEIKGVTCLVATHRRAALPRADHIIVLKNGRIEAEGDLDTLLANYWASKIKGSRLVHDSHEYYTGVPELEGRPFVQKVWKRIERTIFPKLKAIYTVNESIAKLYRDEYRVEVKVVRNFPLLVDRSGQKAKTVGLLDAADWSAKWIDGSAIVPVNSPTPVIRRA